MLTGNPTAQHRIVCFLPKRMIFFRAKYSAIFIITVSLEPQMKSDIQTLTFPDRQMAGREEGS